MTIQTQAPTPGPWTVETDPYHRPSVWSDGKRGSTHEVATVATCLTAEEEQANARLLAAAPELLAACQAALDWIDRFGEHAPIMFGGEADVAQALEAAIAAATGQAVTA